MMGKANEGDAPYEPEQIAAELKRIAERVRQGPLEPTEQKALITAIEALAKRVSLESTVGPAIARQLVQLAEQLRYAPLKRKNGSAA